jgi:hypothetical protein
MPSGLDLVFSAITPAPAVSGFKRVVAIGLPAPLDLMPHLLDAVGRWHQDACDVTGCGVFLRGDTGATVIEHGVPSVPAEAVKTDG